LFAISVYRNLYKTKLIKEIMEGENFNPEQRRKSSGGGIWVATTIIFAALFLVVLFTGFSITGNVTKNNVGNNFVDYINSQGGTQIEYVDSSSFGSNLYQVTVLANDEEVPVFVTKDGKYFVQIISELTKEKQSSAQPEEASTEVTKSDKPKVELFIWSYCPYGVSAQKPFAEVASLLKNSATFDISLYYAGHGEYEAQQNKIQACIQKNYPDKYWEYSTRFVDEIYPNCGSSRDLTCDRDESIKLMKSLGIDSAKIMSCVEKEGQTLVDQDSARAEELGVTGSPTIVVNGVKVNVARNSEAIKSAVCSAFNNAPESCAEVLSSTSATTSGNC